jgi:Lamin Tail Domain/CotH kinase protein
MFYVEAFDNASTAARSVFPEQAPEHPAILRVGEPLSAGSFATWRVWMTPTDALQGSQMGRLSDEPVSCTVVYGNQRVVHNARIRFAGEMLDRANPSLPLSYVLILPADDKIFGIEELLLEPANSTVSFLRAKVAAGLAERNGVACGHQRYAQVEFNGLPPQPVSERQVIDSAFAQSIDATKPLDKLYSAEQWFERDPASGIQTVQSARLTLSPPKTFGRYRWNWPAASFSDYGDFFALLDAMDAPSQTYADHLKAFIDVEKWMDSLALIHVLGEQDVLGYGQGKNAALYRPSADRWLFIPDSFQNAFAGPVNDSLFLTSDPAVAHLLSSPDFVRFYWQAVQRFLAGGFDSASLGSSIDAIAGVFKANGTPLVSSSILNWVDSRRNWILSQTPTNDFTLTTETSLSPVTNLVTITGTASPSTRVLINGSDKAVVWTSPSNWTAMIFVRSGLNVIDVNAVGFNGLLSITRITATVNLPNIFIDKLVINEVMYSPPVPGAGFVELFNANDWPLDLSSLQIPEASYQFPSGTWIPQKGYVVVAENRSAFIEAYGNAIPVIGDAGPGLSRPAGVITLLDSLFNTKVQRIHYESIPPWPLAANGASLQLRDWRQDATRVCNWAAVPAGDPRLRSTPGTTNSVAVQLPDLPRIYLNELQPVNTGIVADQGGQSLPWLELFNASQDVNLEGWYLTDDYANPRKWAFASTDLLPASNYLLVWTGAGSGPLHTGFHLSPTGGQLALVKDDAGFGPLIVDFMNYPQIDPGESYGSFPNGLGARDLVFPSTPGASNPPPPVFINEWMASNTRIVDPSGGGGDDWFELFNAASHARDISGYLLGDSAGNSFSIPNGTLIPGRGFLLCWADKDVSRNRPGGDLHVNFALKAGGDQIRFSTEDGTAVDRVIFGRQTTDISQGRWPDGTPELHFMPMATPGAWNRVTNTSPPLISEIADQILVLGQTLNLQLAATDVDSPLQTFTFSLPSGAPVGVGLQTNGRLTWTPSTEQAPSTNRISVEVTDQGFPPLTRSATFNAIVGLRPMIEQVIGGQGSGLSLLFRGLPGKTYALDYKNSLEDSQWTRLPGTINGTTGLVSVPLPVSTNAQRFFKIEVTN